ncbi:Uncharacterised protein g7843 [Pycnogonum litorale]
MPIFFLFRNFSRIVRTPYSSHVFRTKYGQSVTVGRYDITLSSQHRHDDGITSAKAVDILLSSRHSMTASHQKKAVDISLHRLDDSITSAVDIPLSSRHWPDDGITLAGLSSNVRLLDTGFIHN